MIKLDFSDIEKAPGKYIPVDVRSPSEFAESTITGAVNIPLFTDEQRAAIGTTYKQQGKAQASRLGIEYISQTLPEMYAKYEALWTKQKKILIFCARGGMRSESIAGLLTSLGFPIVKLNGGYKGYRQHVLKRSAELINEKEFITLFGKTGTGKTEILRSLEDAGYDVLDLEKLAGHRGSALGRVGLPPQPSQKAFETRLYDKLVSAKSGVIFTEGESRRIGTVYLPNELLDKIGQGRKVLIDADIEVRKAITKKEYVDKNFDKEEVVAALNTLIRYIGRDKVQEYASLIENRDFDTVMEALMLKYYDIVYNNLNEGYCAAFENKGDSAAVAAELAKRFAPTP